MALMHVDYHSEVLSQSCSMDVIVPQKRARSGFPVLYLLHGGSDCHTNWQRNTSIERYLWGLDMIVVMPAVGFSFYSDQKHGLRYFTFLSEELPEIVSGFFHASTRREDTFAAGLSMGGYGAFKLGIRCPDKFAAVASLSGSISQRTRLTPDSTLRNVVMRQMATETFGTVDDYDRSENDLAWVLEGHLERGVTLPKFYQACGTEDHNYQINVDFQKQFENRIDLTYVEEAGRGHEWSFWDEYIQKVLAWLPLSR